MAHKDPEARKAYRREYMRQYRIDHPEKHRKAIRDWKNRNPEKVQAMYEDRLTSGRNWEACKKWRKDHPEAAAMVGHRYRARLQGATTIEDTMEYRTLLSLDPCAYCGNPGEEIDHIDALINGGTETCDNLTAACKSCNSSKGPRPMLVWMASRG